MQDALLLTIGPLIVNPSYLIKHKTGLAQLYVQHHWNERDRDQSLQLV
jgi:hypothetical protein